MQTKLSYRCEKKCWARINSKRKNEQVNSCRNNKNSQWCRLFTKKYCLKFLCLGKLMKGISTEGFIWHIYSNMKAFCDSWNCRVYHFFFCTNLNLDRQPGIRNFRACLLRVEREWSVHRVCQIDAKNENCAAKISFWKLYSVPSVLRRWKKKKKNRWDWKMQSLIDWRR